MGFSFKTEVQLQLALFTLWIPHKFDFNRHRISNKKNTHIYTSKKKLCFKMCNQWVGVYYRIESNGEDGWLHE